MNKIASNVAPSLLIGLSLFNSASFAMDNIHKAAARGDIEEIREFINAGIPIDTRNQRQETALHVAVQRGHREAVGILLEAKAAVDLQDYIGNTPLHWSFYTRGDVFDSDIATELLRHRADVSIKNKEGKTPLYVAARKKCSHFFQLLLEITDYPSSLVDRAAQACDSLGNQPLAWLVKHELIKPVQFLLEHNANPNATDENEGTPLHHIPSADIAKLLLQHRANPNARNKRQTTPLHLTALNGYHVNTARLLLVYNADPNAQDNHKMTPLHCARNCNSVMVALFLLKHGADPELANEDGQPYINIVADEPKHRWLPDPSYCNYVDLLREDWPFCKAYRRDRILAFIMGVHPRLGRFSPINVLTDHLLLSILELAFPFPWSPGEIHFIAQQVRAMDQSE